MPDFKEGKECLFSLSFGKMVILKWIEHIFSKQLSKIIIGNINRLLGRKKDLYNIRYAFCRNCKSKKENHFIGEYCNICGCPLKSKLRAEDEHCDINKW